MTATPIRATQPPASLPENGELTLNAELEILNTNIALWREVTDDAFERHFRRRYFGNESISRQQAIDRFVAMSAKRVHAAPAHTSTTQDKNGSALNGVAEPSAKARIAAADFRILVLPTRGLPWRPMLLSILTHGLVLSLLLSIRLPQRRNRMIDFDTDTITYYKISESFPNVAPKQRNQLPNNVSEPTPQRADLQTNQEVRIRPMESSQSEIVVEQPNLRQVAALPKLQLPNILLQTSKMDPGREPLIVPADVLRHLATDVQQPQPLNTLPQSATQTLPTRQPALALPQLAAPTEPVSEALPVSQVAGQLTGLQQRAAPLPYAAPPVEDSSVGFQIERIPAQGPDLLVFSVSPTIPKGEINVPKVSSTGRLTGSTPTAEPVPPSGVGELSRAEVVMPAISINSRTAPTVIGGGAAVVQAPPPKPPAAPKPLSPTNTPPLLDFLPSRIPSSKPLVPRITEVGSGESPLRDYESRGGPVYTAAINAPNFTSRRGSWIFRFAELWATEPPSSPTKPGASLTAPTAIVKVDPKYAPEVVREKLEGLVILFAILRKDGTIDGESVRVIRKLDSRLDLSAREALLSWKFKPSQRNGIAVDIQMEVSIPFYFRKEEGL